MDSEGPDSGDLDNYFKNIDEYALVGESKKLGQMKRRKRMFTKFTGFNDRCK